MLGQIMKGFCLIFIIAVFVYLMYSKICLHPALTSPRVPKILSILFSAVFVLCSPEILG